MSAHRKKKRSLEKIEELLEAPIKLSETEQDKFREVWGRIREWLDDALEVVLDMPRDGAYSYCNLLVQALQKVDVDFVGGQKPIKQEVEKESPLPKIKPSLAAILSKIPEDRRSRAYEVLDCLKRAKELTEKGENADQVLCSNCSPEEMLNCINAEDPTIVDPMDEELKKAAK